MSKEQGDRDNEAKAPMHLIPWDAVKEVAKVYGFGAIKYAPRNWEKGLNWSSGCSASLMRHLAAWQQGEDKDEESGLYHDLHIAFNALALVAFRIRGIGKDDRLE